jgi:preprotein translocase subunit SecE
MGKDDATWLNICHGALALLVAYIALLALETLGTTSGWAERYDNWYPLVSRVIALGLGIGAVYFVRSSEERREFHLATISEIRKVTWPSMPDTKRMTIIVAVVVAVFSVILSAFDILWAKILQFILP